MVYIGSKSVLLVDTLSRLVEQGSTREIPGLDVSIAQVLKHLHLHPYWCFRDKLTILDGIIMRGNRVVIPTSVRTATLNRLHDAHQGHTSMLQRARRTVCWPKNTG